MLFWNPRSRRAPAPDVCEDVVRDLMGTDDVELRSLFDQLLYLSGRDPSLQVRLGILTLDMDRAINALQDDDDEDFDWALDRVVFEVDTVDRRVNLARAVITLRDQGRVPPRLAAIAVLEFDRKESTLFLSSVAESLAVLSGDHRTPTGLLVAMR